LGLVVTAAAIALLPPLTGHLGQRKGKKPIARMLARHTVQLSLLTTAAVMVAGFSVIPNIANYVEMNLGYPHERLKILYFAGGLATMVTMRFIGILVDRQGSFRVGSVGSAALAVIIYVLFVRPIPNGPIMAYYIAFMLGMALRNVAYNTLASRVPHPNERAGFMSIQSAVQHGASALGAFAAARILHEGKHHELLNVGGLALLSIAATAIIPPLLGLVERRVRNEPTPLSTPEVPLDALPGALPKAPRPG
jgi:predicted MFS family arabinose efflux permease